MLAARSKKPAWFFCLLIGVFLFLTIGWRASKKPAAVNMQSENYRIQWGNINIGGRKLNSGSYNLGVTMGQTAPGLYASTGYKVRAGFQYIYSIIPFTFSISSLEINFGTLTPNTPATATNTLTISAGGAGGYQVLAYETHPLRSETGEEIPDTTCDSGNCSETTAGVWTSNSTYGFGFNISGDDTPSDFVDSTYFRQFANFEAGEEPQVVMSRSGVTRQSQATVSYKVNIAPTQAAGNYETQIVYLAIPVY